MPTSDTVRLAPASTYAALLTDIRLAALRALADVIATSDDPTEKRLAAVAILRAPEPEPPPVLVRSLPQPHPVRSYEKGIAEADAHALRAQTHPTHQFDAQSLASSLATARRLLTEAGIPLNDPLAGLDLLDDFNDVDPVTDTLDPLTAPNSPATRLAAAAGQAPSG